ncbi:hypothetical protein KDA00_05935 [Candidatus Saccharibacteria bacterium]|nr:hypothetical protein [Candidatus Saccharibacteria bacterium]
MVKSEKNNTTQVDEDFKPPEESQELLTNVPVININSHKRNSKIIITVFVILFLIITGTVGYLWYTSKDKTSKNKENHTTDQQQIIQSEEDLSAVAYSYGSAEKDGIEFFWRPIEGGDRRSAKNIGQNNYPTFAKTYKNQVAVVSTPSSGSTVGDAIWYSLDSGKSYSSIASLKLPEPEKPSDQITSMIFSRNGSAIVYSELFSDGKQSTVKLINPETKESKDLVTISGKALFLQGYDEDSGLLYYFSGCYNCDGNTMDKLFSYNTQTKEESVIYDLSGKIGVQNVISNDYSKILILEGSLSTEGLGANPPYNLREYDLKGKNFKDLLTFNEGDNYPIIGYRASDNLPYYSSGKSIIVLREDGTKTTVFEAERPIVNILYVGQNQIVSSSGTYEDYILTSYVTTSKRNSEILSGDQSTVLFGVVTK